MLGLFGKYKRYPGFVFLAVLLGFWGGAVSAGTVLTLENPKDDIRIELSEEDLLAFPQVVVSTENEFVDGMAEFSGPLARDILSLLGDDFDSAEFTAINDYSIVIPVSDFQEYDVILALTMNGQKFSLRDKGPIWLIYPMSDHKELQDRVYNNRLIWQLTRITAR